MARIRTIKPDFFTSEDIVALSPFARLLYIALWCEADREGRMAWKPATFKLRYFPGDKVNVENLSAELTGRSLVILYGSGLAYIPTFLEHQHVNPREAASALPPPRVEHASARVSDEALRDSDTQVGREGKERKEHASNDARFETFWISYPRKVAKHDASRAFKKLALVNGDFEKVLAALEAAKASEQWQRDEGKFIPHASTWLNGRRFEDEGHIPPTIKVDV